MPAALTAQSAGNASVPSAAERAAVRSLGPRVVTVKLGRDEQILDMALFDKVAAAPIMGRAFYGDWRRRLASQWLGRSACRDAVLKHEASRGAAYTTYARVRLDINFFAPLPSSFAAPAAEIGGGAWAMVPAGEDFGANNSGINDRMLFGGAAAFAADAELWRSMLNNDSFVPDGWISESVTKAQLAARGVKFSRAPLAYCILTTTGACKYPGELLQRQPRPGANVHGGRRLQEGVDHDDGRGRRRAPRRSPPRPPPPSPHLLPACAQIEFTNVNMHAWKSATGTDFQYASLATTGEDADVRRAARLSVLHHRLPLHTSPVCARRSPSPASSRGMVYRMPRSPASSTTLTRTAPSGRMPWSRRRARAAR